MSPISSDNPPLLQQDLEAIYRALNQLTVSKPSVTPPIQESVFVPSGQIEVKEVDGSPDLFVDGIETTSSDITVTESGNLAQLNLADVVAAAGPIGDATHVATTTIDAKGRVTALTSTAISFPTAGTTVPIWRVRTHMVAMGANVILDSSWWKVPTTPGPAATGVNYPAGGPAQRNFGLFANSPGGGLLLEGHQNQWNIIGRLGLRVVGTPSINVWVPNVDDNFGLYLEGPSNDTGTVTTVGTAVTGSGTSFQAGDVGKLLLITSGGAPSGQANLITARASTTAITLQEAYSTNASATNFKLLTKLVQRSNGVAQSPTDATSNPTLATGDSVLWLFANNDGLQMALNMLTDAFDTSGVTWYELGVESFT